MIVNVFKNNRIKVAVFNSIYHKGFKIVSSTSTFKHHLYK